MWGYDVHVAAIFEPIHPSIANHDGAENENLHSASDDMPARNSQNETLLHEPIMKSAGGMTPNKGGIM